jgi:SpoU rRNA methylase family enzyme
VDKAEKVMLMLTPYHSEEKLFPVAKIVYGVALKIISLSNAA